MCSQKFFFRNIGMTKIFFLFIRNFFGNPFPGPGFPPESRPFVSVLRICISEEAYRLFTQTNPGKKNRSPPKVRSGVSLISTNLTLTSLLPADAFTSARKLKLCLMLKRFRRNAIPNLIYFSKNQKIVLVREPIFDTGNHALNLSDGNVQFFQRCFQNLRDARFIVKR